MASENETHHRENSSVDAFDGRDLLVGRPEGAERRSPAATGKAEPSPPTPTPVTSPQPAAHDDTHDDAITEILATVRATAARIDALQDEPDRAHENAETLTRETAALAQAVADARGALAKAAELAARKDGAAEAARTLAQGAAALNAQGEALDKRLHATGYQSEMAAETTAELKKVATSLESNLRIHASNMFRINQDQRWRPVLTGLAIGAASFVFFALGLVLQRETDFVSFGDPRDAWNDFVAEHYAPSLAICASKARLDERTIRCGLDIDPSLDVTVPFYPGTLTKVSSEGEFDPVAEQ